MDVDDLQNIHDVCVNVVHKTNEQLKNPLYKTFLAEYLCEQHQESDSEHEKENDEEDQDELEDGNNHEKTDDEDHGGND